MIVHESDRMQIMTLTVIIWFSVFWNFFQSIEAISQFDLSKARLGLGWSLGWIVEGFCLTLLDLFTHYEM